MNYNIFERSKQVSKPVSSEIFILEVTDIRFILIHVYFPTMNPAKWREMHFQETNVSFNLYKTPVMVKSDNGLYSVRGFQHHGICQRKYLYRNYEFEQVSLIPIENLNSSWDLLCQEHRNSLTDKIIFSIGKSLV